jgi:hypothetical protein
MGSILITTPNIDDSQLIYDETETKKILRFFWPRLKDQIESITITNDTRRLAQTALIAAINGSYPMGYITATFKSAFFPLANDIKSIIRKMAFHYISTWWKQGLQRKDLEHAQIYESIRNAISYHLRFNLETIIKGAAIKRLPLVFYAYVSQTSTVLS